ncbi:MAG: immunoglobulin domain-containing protein [Phycisphaeraceae bacterium]|nr:immunoglobulin domain-containing protein [Phycisphaeraceae bacterium]
MHHDRKWSAIPRLLPIAFGVVAGGLSPAHADTLTWTGAGDGSTFGMASNWSPAAAPNQTYDCIIPAGATPIVVANNVQVRSLSTARNLFVGGCVMLNFRAGMTLSSGAVITIDNPGGCPALFFQGGTQSIEGSGQIVVSNGNNNSILTLTNHAALSIGPGISLTYGANAGGPGASLAVGDGCSLTNFGTISFARAGAQFTIEGNGTFTNRGKLDMQAGTLVVYQMRDQAGQILVSPNAAARISGDSYTFDEPLNVLNGADVLIDGNFTVAAPINVTDAHLQLFGNWTNSSQISSVRSTTSLVGKWTNLGTLEVVDSDFIVGGFSPDLGAHQFTDVRLTYTEQLPDEATFTADSSTGDITLDSVLLNKGELRTLDGARFLFKSSPYHPAPSTLTACRLDGEFSIESCTLVRVYSGLTLLNGSRVVLSTGCFNGLSFEGPPQSVSGAGEFVAVGPDEFGAGLYYMLTVRSELTMENGITFRVPPSAVPLGTRKIVIETGRFINRGTILMQAPGGDFAIVGGYFNNQGVVEATAGQARVYPWTLDNLSPENKLTGGTWRAINASISFDTSTIKGIGPGTEITLEGPLGSIPQFATLNSNAGTLHIRSRTQTIVPSGAFTNSGTLDLASDATFAVTGAAAFSSLGSLRTQVAGLNPGQIGRFTATGPVSIAGKLQGSFAPSYIPIDGDISAPIVESPQITGSFASYCFDPSPFELGVVPLFDAGPPNRVSLQVSASAGIPPRIVSGPVNTSATPGVAFSVDASPSNLAYEWKRDGTLLVDGPTATGSLISGATTSQLLIQRAQPSDVGQYTVTVSTPCASATSEPAWLRLCNGDFNSDLMVDDSDFGYFAANYDILDCTDPLMHQGCPGDFNFDGLVDDADFTAFVVAYDTLVCPQLSVCSCHANEPPGPDCLLIRCP